MRSALGISLALHLVVSLIALNWVSFRSVKYIPRQVYNVTLVTPPVQAQPPVLAPQVQPEPEPEPEEELAPPPEKPRPKPKPVPPPKKTVPTTQVEKTQPDPEAEPQEAPPETGDVTLDTEDFPFAHYISRMRRKIAASWRVPEGSQGEDRFCRIYFRVHRDGSVSHVSVEETSGLFMFDQSAQRAVVQAASMPPLPREYGEEYLGVHFSFAYREKR